MITYQDVRRNMCEAEKIYANDKVSARRIEEENEKKIKEGYSKERRSEKSSCVQMDAGSNVQQRDRSTNTREQRAKIAGVGTGTVARFNKVMNSDDEELKKKVLANEVSINAGYEKVIETNIRQRGIGNPNPMKLGRCIKELERIYDISKGNNQHSRLPNNSVSSQDDLAKELGISVDTLQNYKKLTELVPELQDWVETGNVIVICVVYHIPFISCTYVYLACKSVLMCWCRILG